VGRPRPSPVSSQFRVGLRRRLHRRRRRRRRRRREKTGSRRRNVNPIGG